MTPLVLDINLVNPAFHKKAFTYTGDFGPGRPNTPVLEFHHISEWRDYLLTLQIRSAKVPGIHADAYHVALHMLLLAWADASLIKPAELQGLRSLEAALTGVYFQPIFEREKGRREKARKTCGGCKKCLLCSKLDRETFRPGLDNLLDYMVAHDCLDRTLHNENKKASGNALSVIRNVLAHGDISSSGLPWGGLFEAIREVMEHACRSFPEPPEYPPEVLAVLGVQRSPTLQ